jgi:hypothetical protein
MFSLGDLERASRLLHAVRPLHAPVRLALAQPPLRRPGRPRLPRPAQARVAPQPWRSRRSDWTSVPDIRHSTVGPLAPNVGQKDQLNQSRKADIPGVMWQVSVAPTADSKCLPEPDVRRPGATMTASACIPDLRGGRPLAGLGRKQNGRFRGILVESCRYLSTPRTFRIGSAKVGRSSQFRFRRGTG